MFFLGGGKCPNLGVVDVRILGVVNVLLANDSQSKSLVSLLLAKTQRQKPRVVQVVVREGVKKMVFFRNIS